MTNSHIDANAYLKLSIQESLALISIFDVLDKTLTHEEKCALVYRYQHPNQELQQPLQTHHAVLYNNGLIDKTQPVVIYPSEFQKYALTSLGVSYREHLVVTDAEVAYVERCYVQPSFHSVAALRRMTLAELCDYLVTDRVPNTGLATELAALGLLEPTEQVNELRPSVKGKLILQTFGFAGQKRPDNYLAAEELRILEQAFICNQVECERIDETVRDTLKAKGLITYVRCVDNGPYVAMPTDKASDYVLGGRIVFPDSLTPDYVIRVLFTNFYSWIHSWGIDSDLIVEKIVPKLLLWVRSSGLEKRFRDDPNTQIELPKPTSGLFDTHGAKRWLTDYLTDLLEIGKGLSDA